MTISAGPPASGTTTGRPAASASTTTIPKGSSGAAWSRQVAVRELVGGIGAAAEDLDVAGQVGPGRPCPQAGHQVGCRARDRSPGQRELQAGQLTPGDGHGLEREVGPLPLHQRPKGEHPRRGARVGRWRRDRGEAGQIGAGRHDAQAIGEAPVGIEVRGERSRRGR